MMSNGLRRLSLGFFSFFPPACAGCDGSASPSTSFCSICAPTVHRIKPPFCDLCMVPMQSFEAPGEARTLCSSCYERSPAFDSVRALWEYDGALADAVRRVKYGADFPALRALGRGVRLWFDEQLQALPQEAPIFCVPSHSKELRRRGFHLPTEALKIISPEARRRLRGGLEKTRHTPAQAGLPFGARQSNMKGAFRWSQPVIAGRGPAILFDDVLTTGATASAASQALKVAGFDRVYVIVLARARAAFEPSRRSPVVPLGRSG